MNNLENEHHYFHMVMDQYGEEIKRVVFTYVRNWQTAEDITQEIFLTIYQHLPTFQGKASIRTWIYKIAINKCKDYLKSWHHRKTVITEKISFLKHAPSPVDLLEAKEEKADFLKDLDQLSLKYKEILILYYYADFTLKEIALMLNIKDSTARTRLKRARESLSCILERRDFNEE